MDSNRQSWKVGWTTLHFPNCASRKTNRHKSVMQLVLHGTSKQPTSSSFSNQCQASETAAVVMGEKHIACNCFISSAFTKRSTPLVDLLRSWLTEHGSHVRIVMVDRT